MRVVGGQWRGRAIDAPAADGPSGGGRSSGKRAVAPRGRPSPRGRAPLSAPPSLRPTTDRARETLFNVLAHDAELTLPGAAVLDVFAGTGALGIEALSRGAAHATFIERDAAARRLIAASLARLGGTGRATILAHDATRPPPAPRAHGLVLLDPPYGEGLGERALGALHATGWLAENARVVIEEEADAVVAWPPGFEALREIAVGGTRFHLGRCVKGTVVSSNVEGAGDE